MAYLVDLLNVGKCANGAFLGTSTDFCQLDIDRLKEIWRLPYNYKFPANFEFTKEDIQDLQSAGKLVKIYTFKTSSDTTEDNSVNTYVGGKKSLMDKMPIQIDATLENGTQGYQSILSVEKAKYHSFLLVDENDTIFMAKGSDGIARALNSDFFQVMPYKMRGDNPASFSIQFQLDRKQFDNDLHGLNATEYNFDVNDILGITDLDLVITAPANNATSVQFKALRNTDRKNLNQEGLEALIGIKIKVDGVVKAGSVTVSGDYYVFTPTSHTFATGEVVEIEILTEFLNDVPYRAFAKSVVVL